MMALYIKFVYNKDPHFANTKVVYSIYEDSFDAPWDSRLPEKLMFDGVSKEVAETFTDTSCVGITRSIAQYVDGINVGTEAISTEMQTVFDTATCPKLAYVPEENQAKELSAFFDKIIDESVLA
jgi:starch synthase